MAITRDRWLLLLIVVVTLAMVAGLAAGAGAPTDEGNGNPPGDDVFESEGDWTVEASDGHVQFENKTLILNGNLTVDFGGKLTLKNVKMVMNCTQDLVYHVAVEVNGLLELMDLDGDPDTGGDKSIIRSVSPRWRYNMTVQRGSTFTVLRSDLTNLGRDPVIGLELYSSGATIEDAVIEEFNAIFVDQADPVLRRVHMVGYNASSLFFNKSGALLEECLITNCYFGINVNGTPSPTVIDTTAANCFYPLIMENAVLTMTGGELIASRYGKDVRMNLSSHATLVDVKFDPESVEILDEGSDLEVRWTLELNITDQDLLPLEDATVEINDTNGETVFDGTTDAQGRAKMVLTDYEQTMTGRTLHNPHSGWISKGRYHKSFERNITETTFLDIRMTTNQPPIILVRSPSPGSRYVMGQAVLLDASDSFDPNGDQLHFEWTTDIAGRVLFSGTEAVAISSLLIGETTITLTVSDGFGGVNLTTISVEVLQASTTTMSVTTPQYIATIQATYGGPGDLVLEAVDYPKPYSSELIGVFVRLRSSGDAILVNGTLVIRYEPTLIPFGMNESTLVVAIEDGGFWTDVAGSSVDVEDHVVDVGVVSFGLYAIKGVIPPNIPPRIFLFEDGGAVALHDFEVEVGDPVGIVLTIEDELPNFATLDVEDLPTFLKLDRSTKQIWGDAPDTAGNYTLAMTVTDVGGLMATATIYLNVTGAPAPPELHNGDVLPRKAETGEVMEVLVVYFSEDNLPPVFVRVEWDDESREMVPVDPEDTDYIGGVMYQTFLKLSSGKYKLYFNTSDGRLDTRTSEYLEVEVELSSLAPTNMEAIIIVTALIAIVVVLIVIRMTSSRYRELKDAHLGKDREDRIEYISPEKAEPEEEVEAEPEGEGGEAEPEGEEEVAEPEGDVHVLKEPETLEELDEDVERLEEELKELDNEIDREEEEIAKIDEEIEDIIDELESDKDRAK
jgi:hypothetical protein